MTQAQSQGWIDGGLTIEFNCIELRIEDPEPGLWWGGLRFEGLENLVVSKAAIMTKTNVFFLSCKCNSKT